MSVADQSVPEMDLSQAVAFLKGMHPEEYWNLVAIHAETSRITATGFGPNDEDKAKAWIEKHNAARCNIYFQVGSAGRRLNKKASKADIRSVSNQWVDIDPDYAGRESADEAKDAALVALRSQSHGIPLPTAIVDSGGGIQAYWKLKDPVQIKDRNENAAEIESRNKHLEKVFDADNCSNIDRIMRLPGTINWPNAKKRKYGRVPAPAKLLEHDPERIYDIAQFPKLETAKKSKKLPVAPEAVPDCSRQLESIADLDEWNVPERTKQIITDGRNVHEGPKEGDDSRSAWLFDGLCELIRCEVPDEVAAVIITDPRFKISESVLEKPNPKQYARRQIERAASAVVDPLLLEMNDRHAVIENHGGKCIVIEKVRDDPLNRDVLTVQPFEEFKKRYCNQLVEVGCNAKGDPKRIAKGKWWLDHPKRRSYQQIVFAPNRDIPDAYNLWEGFTVKPVPGDWSLFRDHILHIVCGGDEDCFQYLIRWMARCVQEPGGSGQVAIVLRGEKGCGKSMYVEIFGRPFGIHYLSTTNAEHIAGRFNEHLETVVVLFGDEAFFAGNKDHERTLKGLVTQDEVSYEGKGRPVKHGLNRVHLLLASNSTWVVPAHGRERRYFVLDVSDKKIGDREYFSSIAQQMKSGGTEAMLHDLLNMDLSNFEVRDFPQTAALQEQQQESAKFEESAMVEILKDGFTPDHEFHGCGPNELSADGLLEFAVHRNLVGRVDQQHSSRTRLGHFIKTLARRDAEGKPVSRRRRRRNKFDELSASRINVHELRPLEELREEFKYLVGPEGWGEAKSEWTDLFEGSPDYSTFDD